MQKITKTLPVNFSLKPFGPKTPERDLFHEIQLRHCLCLMTTKFHVKHWKTSAVSSEEKLQTNG